MAESGRRTVFVGDVHGCRPELERLLEQVQFSERDRLVFVGDLVARGPDSLGVLAIARALGAVVVRGNHEERVLRELGLGATFGGSPSRPHQEIAARLSQADVDLLRETPLYRTFDEHGLTVVHAGIDPEEPLHLQRPETLLFVRNARTPSGKKRLWGEVHEGPVSYVFGHNAIEKLQLHPFATGLDTGCVYGGALTALVLDENETLPRDVTARRAKLVSVPAERVWFDPHTRDD